MSHPLRFDARDPLLRRVREIALGFPGAAEKISHGRPSFYTRKIFCLYGGLLKGDDHWSTAHARAVLVLPDAGEREALLTDRRFFHPAFHGPAGWVGLDLAPGRPDWTEVAELIDASFRNTAGKRLVAKLDANRRSAPGRQ